MVDENRQWFIDHADLMHTWQEAAKQKAKDNAEMGFDIDAMFAPPKKKKKAAPPAGPAAGHPGTFAYNIFVKWF